MDCLTDEQFAGVALGLADEKHVRAHVEACAICRTKLAAIRQLSQQLTAAHAELDQVHAASRSRLLASLAAVDAPTRPASLWNRLTRQLEGLTMRQRVAFGGVGLTTVVGLVLLLLTLNSATRLSAMERMVKAVREVKSCSFQFWDTFTRTSPSGNRRYERHDLTYWQAPDPALGGFGSLHSETKSEWVTQAEGDTPKEGLDVVEICPAGKPGIWIDHIARTYYRTPVVQPSDVPKDAPIRMVNAVREGLGRFVRDLGTKRIHGQNAHGYVLAFNGAAPFRSDEVEVWVDPETDLPLEFSFHNEFEEGNRRVPEEYRITDCRWNIAIDPKLFDTTPPVGYIDTTPPRDDNGIAEIVAGLKVYAELSGGHYPPVATLADDAVREELQRIAASAARDNQHRPREISAQQIKDADTGLEWLSRVLLNKPYHAEYFGDEVSPRDTDKVLLWWTLDALDSYRVFYGDLRTEVVSAQKLAELVPSAAKWVLPE